LDGTSQFFSGGHGAGGPTHAGNFSNFLRGLAMSAYSSCGPVPAVGIGANLSQMPMSSTLAMLSVSVHAMSRQVLLVGRWCVQLRQQGNAWRR
jgi:hypothetical protein